MNILLIALELIVLGISIYLLIRITKIYRAYRRYLIGIHREEDLKIVFDTIKYFIKKQKK